MQRLKLGVTSHYRLDHVRYFGRLLRSDVNKDLRHKAKASKNNCSRPRTNITDYESTNPCRRPADLIGWLVGSTNQPTVVIYFKECNYGRLGLPWQLGGNYILQPFSLFIYYLFWNKWNRTSFSPSPWGELG